MIFLLFEKPFQKPKTPRLHSEYDFEARKFG